MKSISIVVFLLFFLILTFSKAETILQPKQEDNAIIFLTSAGNKLSLDGTWKAECVHTNSMNITETFMFIDSVFTIQIEMFEEGKCGEELLNERNVKIEFGVVGTIEANLGDRTVTANKIKGRFKFDDVAEYKEYKQSIYIEEIEGKLTLFHGIFEEDGGRLSEDGYPLDLFQIPITKITGNN